jgi:hypothetical protein
MAARTLDAMGGKAQGEKAIFFNYFFYFWHTPIKFPHKNDQVRPIGSGASLATVLVWTPLAWTPTTRYPERIPVLILNLSK